jgi:hypothetical protein
VQEFRFWVPWVEASYYEMTCDPAITKWLKTAGAQVVYSQLESTPRSPAHVVAVHEERKQVIVLVRGTEEASSVLTDMISVFSNGLQTLVHAPSINIFCATLKIQLLCASNLC